MVKVWKEKPKERYCLEFFLQSESLPKTVLSDKLKDTGSSTIIAGTDNLFKVHIHTNKPDEIVKAVSLLGEVSRVKIDDMFEQQQKFLSNKQADSQDHNIGVIVVTSGKGWKEVFKSLGATYIINCRKTMNPSVNELLKAIEKVNCSNIILLPNDENILPGAQQSVSLTSKNVEIVPSKTMPEGISSLLSFNPEYSLEENKKQMEEILNVVCTGIVARATRPIKNKDLEVGKGDFIGLSKKEIITRGEDYQIVALDLINSMIKEDSKLVTIYWGKDTKDNIAKKLCEEVKNKFPDVEVELYYGGQFYYYYIISIE